jgi:hypothetical protein
MFSIYNMKEKEVKERREKCQKRNSLSKNKRGVVERTNST